MIQQETVVKYILSVHLLLKAAFHGITFTYNYRMQQTLLLLLLFISQAI